MAQRSRARSSASTATTSTDTTTLGLVGFALLLSLQLAGEWLSRAFTLAMPGPVVGLLLLLPLLAITRVREPVGVCADFLLAHLSLLFINDKDSANFQCVNVNVVYVYVYVCTCKCKCSVRVCVCVYM